MAMKKFQPINEANRRHLIEQLREAYHTQEGTPEDFLPPRILSGRYGAIFCIFNPIL